MNELEQWLLDQQPVLDSIIASACRDFWKQNRNKENFVYDLKQTQLDQYNLMKGQDLCYDRITTPLSYALWYHPRRINTFLSLFKNQLLELSGKEIQIVDLGAGTGAVQQAIFLVAYGMKKHGITPPSFIHVVNVDSSPFMLHFNRDYLWKRFLKHYDFPHELDYKDEYEINPWSKTRKISQNYTIIVASYLFDASDEQKNIKHDFLKLVEKEKPLSMLLSTSQHKKQHLTALAVDFQNIGYVIDPKTRSKLLYTGSLSKINALRQEIRSFHPDVSSNISGEATWPDKSYAGLVIRKTQADMIAEPSAPINKATLYRSSIKIISDIVLNEDQEKAARYEKSPSVIQGPAGCGKSIVICHKVVNTAKNFHYTPSLKILVTTFNKLLLQQLAAWLKKILDEENQLVYQTTKDKVWYFQFADSKIKNITLLHFDILPSRIDSVNNNKRANKINYKGDEKVEKVGVLENCISEVKEKESITGSDYDNILNTKFLLEEYHRVIYGLGVGIKNGHDIYQDIERTGRGEIPSLPKNGKRRELVFEVLKKYATRLYKEKILCFTQRRQLFLQELKNFPDTKKYDYVFVDELQDCTQADFRIFRLLLKDPNHLCVAGDIAQAIHIGKSARIPQFEGIDRKRIYRLKASYRLPVRVGEAIKPISEQIKKDCNLPEDVDVIIPYKDAPPGARPIVVYGSSEESLASKIAAIIDAYKVYGIHQSTVLEKDKSLLSALRRLKVPSETDTILRLKGLERRCIIWSTRTGIKNEEEVYEIIYTILSRTSSILVVALFDDTHDSYKPVIGKLRQDRLIFWDSETEEQFKDLIDIEVDTSG